MRRYSILLASFAFSLLLLGVNGCSDSTPSNPPGGNPPDTTSVLTSFKIQTVSGALPFALDSTMVSEKGISYKVSKFRFYMSEFTLLDSTGASIPATLLDATGKPVPYNLILADYEIPESLQLRFMAKPGNYRGVKFTVGVPLLNAKGDSLNHTDASVNLYPLNVDADMYWTWKAGYIHFKIEGRAYVKADSLVPFIYHVGDDKRVSHVTLNSPIEISAARNSATLLADANRLFVTPGGNHLPNMIGTPGERLADSGHWTDTVSVNLAGSGFFKLKQ